MGLTVAVDPSLTFDTGALIAWERNHAGIKKAVQRATELGRRIYVPEVVIAEWWRGSGTRRSDILDSVTVDDLTVNQAKAAGEVLAVLKDAIFGARLTIDALVMASAGSRGDIVYTSDPDDLLRLKDHFPAVRMILRA